VKLDFEFFNQSNLNYPSKKLFDLADTIIIKFLKDSNHTIILLSVFLVNSQKMRSLNREYCKKNKSTTVLSFPQDEPLKNPKIGEKIILGDIFLCPEEIGKSENDLEYFFLHGLLHLLGLNHKEIDKYKNLWLKT